jgi:excisionase family DNA binding protein
VSTVKNLPSAARESPDVLVRPAPGEEEELQAFLDALAGSRREDIRVVLADHYGALQLPLSAYRALVRAVMYLAAGKAVTLVPHAQELTTQSAAILLNVSRPYVIKLLEDKVIPSRRVGTHRRIAVADVLAYRDRVSEVQPTTLRQAARLTESHHTRST